MSRPVWLVDIIKKGFPTRFLLARLTRVPVLKRVMDYLFFENDDMIYLPKDTVVQVNQSVATPGEMVLPSQVVDYFIEKANYHWVMNFCICRDSSACADYPIKLGCLFLGEAAMKINPELGRKVTKEEALQHVKQCREAGLIHLIGRNKLDAVWLNVGPGNKLLTVCNCCPCCCLWRMLPDLAPDIGRKVTKMPGVTIAVTDRCVGCGTCSNVCFVNAINVVNNRAVINDECRGCGRCVDVCPQKALHISIDDQYVEKSIDRIAELVDVS
ncbi:MAG: 4Fe-4S binding protein [Theionarchaea archaeon]|nr:MAG: 4Fe-4S ferredoxin [Theionarchaea archaeon DG-70-1]MBU7027235.1 4Fe-4S binding protein [Theionarchaea archaeon]